jgi:hypothetical protein
MDKFDSAPENRFLENVEMCRALYLFTNDKITEIEWAKEKPGVWIQAVDEKNDRNALLWPHEEQNTYYLGGYQGCGCGWAPVSKWDESTDIAQKQQDRNTLVELLMSIDFEKAWLVLSWEGDQGKLLLEPVNMQLKRILDVKFEFEELRKYVFRP